MTLWIDVTNELPMNNTYVLVHLVGLPWHDEDDHEGNRFFKVVKFIKGITEEYRKENNINVIRSEDQYGNNHKPYCWKEFGLGSYFGQEVDYWMNIPTLKPTNANRDKEKREMTTIEEATMFFDELFYGNHHLPSKVTAFGHGWCVSTCNSLATYDSHYLTRLVLLAHDKCFRVEVLSGGIGRLKIAVWKRSRDGRMFEKHPTIQQALEEYNPLLESK